MYRYKNLLLFKTLTHKALVNLIDKIYTCIGLYRQMLSPDF